MILLPMRRSPETGNYEITSLEAWQVRLQYYDYPKEREVRYYEIPIKPSLTLRFTPYKDEGTVTIYQYSESRKQENRDVSVITGKNPCWSLKACGEAMQLLQAVWLVTGVLYRSVESVPVNTWTDEILYQFQPLTQEFLCAGIEAGFAPIVNEKGTLCAWA